VKAGFSLLRRDSVDGRRKTKGGAVAAVTVRNLDDRVKERLRLLAQAVSDPDDDKGLLITLLERFAGLGGVELELPARSAPVSPCSTPGGLDGAVER